MHRDTDDAGLVGNGTGNRLANPPGSVGTEFKTLIGVELFDRPQQPCITLLNQIQKVQPAAAVALGNTHHQAHVGFGHFILGALIAFFNLLGKLQLFITRQQGDFTNFAQV